MPNNDVSLNNHSDQLIQLRVECDAVLASLQGNARIDWDDLEALTTASLELGLYGLEVLLFAAMSHHNFAAADALPQGVRAALTHATECHEDALDDLIKLQELSVRIHDQTPGSQLDRSMPVVIEFAQDMLSYWRGIQSEYSERCAARARSGVGRAFSFAFRS